MVAFRWTDVEDNMLGKYPDKHIARFIGVCLNTVYCRRRKLKIKANGGEHRKEVAKHLGKTVKCKLVRQGNKYWSAKLKRDYPHYKKAKVINWFRIDPLLGTDFDYKIADQFQISEKTVCCRRVKLKILPFQPPKLTKMEKLLQAIDHAKTRGKATNCECKDHMVTILVETGGSVFAPCPKCHPILYRRWVKEVFSV